MKAHVFIHHFYTGVACGILVTPDNAPIKERWIGRPDIADVRLEAEYQVWYCYVQEMCRKAFGQNIRVDGGTGGVN